MLHHLIDSIKDNIPSWNLLQLFRRFIDDIFSLWLGTTRQFHSFVSKLNELSAHFGIKFGDCSIGESVHFLDVTLFIDSEGFIQYRLFTKPTDSRLYLRTSSFHPKHVFRSVAFSQLSRVKRRNSTKEFEKEDIEQLIKDLEKCGYDRERLSELVAKLGNSKPEETDTGETLTLVVPYFQELEDLKSFISSLDSDIKTLSGSSTRTIVASRKGRSVASTTVKNGQLCKSSPAKRKGSGQQCGAKGCKTCPLIAKDAEMIIGGTTVKSQEGLTCKSKNVIYMAQCKLCHEDDKKTGELSVYAGQTQQPLHKRINGHRSCFKNDAESWEKSALSKHAFEEHFDENFNMSIYRITAYKQCPSINLNRLESKTINEFRLGVLGLNRMKIQKE